MNMKKRSCINELVWLICICVLAALQAAPAQASSVVSDTIEQSVTQEEVKPIESPVQNDSPAPANQINSEDSTNSIQETDSSSVENSVTEEEQSASNDEAEATEEVTQEVTETAPQVQKSNKNVSEKKQSSHKKSRKHFMSLSKIFDKLSTIFHKIPHSLAQSKHSKHNKNKDAQNQNVITRDFAPYYFLIPSFENNYLEKIVYPEKITNAAEFLPYSLAIRKLDFKINPPKNAVTPQGIDDISVLINAPSPQIEVLGKQKFAKLVIDIRNNTLYKYDKEGFPLKAYLVATGARGTRTMAGLRVVTYKERFPYSGAPNSKRALDPYSYGPYIIFLNQVDPKTGRQCCVEQLLHGNGNEYSIGRKVSHGCIRTNNNVMRKELSKEVVRGDYILLINPDIN